MQFELDIEGERGAAVSSDTPRTDAAERAAGMVYAQDAYEAAWVLARQLERELAQSQAALADAQHDLREITADRDSWRDQAEQRMADAAQFGDERDAALEAVRRRDAVIESGINGEGWGQSGACNCSQCKQRRRDYVSAKLKSDVPTSGLLADESKGETR